MHKVQIFASSHCWFDATRTHFQRFSEGKLKPSERGGGEESETHAHFQVGIGFFERTVNAAVDKIDNCSSWFIPRQRRDSSSSSCPPQPLQPCLSWCPFSWDASWRHHSSSVVVGLASSWNLATETTRKKTTYNCGTVYTENTAPLSFLQYFWFLIGFVYSDGGRRRADNFDGCSSWNDGAPSFTHDN